jgi:hypothetical protein
VEPPTGTVIYDRDRNGHPDARGYRVGGQLLRLEIDQNEDGIVEQWVYLDPDGQPERIGISSMGDGIPDVWAYPGPDRRPERIARAGRDGTIDRTEFYEQGVIVRAEQDANHDSQVDRWETYSDGRLTRVVIDTDRDGRPDRSVAHP